MITSSLLRATLRPRPRGLPHLPPRPGRRTTTTTPLTSTPSAAVPPPPHTGGLLPPHSPPTPRFHQRYLTRPLLRALHWYGSHQLRVPWKTQLATSLIINLLSDFNAQHLFPVSPTASYDYHRTLNFIITGLLFAIPGNEWYTRISTAFSSLPRILAIGSRVAASQLVFSPLFLIGFFAVQAGLEGEGFEGVVGRPRERLMGAWGDSLCFWPVVGVINFAFVRLEYRALVGGVAGLGWGTWLSYLNSRGGEEVRAETVRLDALDRVVEVEKGVVEKAVKTEEAMVEKVKEVLESVPPPAAP